MKEAETLEQLQTKNLFDLSQRHYLTYLESLLPKGLIQTFGKHQNNKWDETMSQSMSSLSFFDLNFNKTFHRGIKNGRGKAPHCESKKCSNLYQFFNLLVGTMAKLRYIEQFGEFQPITKQLGIDLKQLNKLDSEPAKTQFMLSSIDKSIEQQKRKLCCSKNSIQSMQAGGGNTKLSFSKPSSFVLQLGNVSSLKQNNYLSSQAPQKKVSKYRQLLKERSKNENDDFSWLQIKTNHSMLEKKLKSKLIQSINESQNEKRIRDLIQKKQNRKKVNTSNLESENHSQKSGQAFTYIQNNEPLQGQIDDEKVDLINESLFMEEFQKAKIDYVWTDKDEQLFIENIKALKKKCSNNSEFLKLCKRFKFVSQKEFQTLACQEISRLLNKSNKIYLSRQFLLDKYFSSTEVLSQQEMRFILKTSPMLSKCVDKNFIKAAVKNIRYQNISDLELKIAEDIIARFQKVRNSARISRKAYKQKINIVTKERITFFQRKKQLEVAKQLARQQLKSHKLHLIRALHYQSKREPSTAKNKGLQNKNIPHIWTPLNKFHPSTGLFVKDCNEQCTDDLFNPYEREYLAKLLQPKIKQKQSLVSKAEMLKFYTGGPNEGQNSNFNINEEDVKDVCSIIKGYFFEKRILGAFQGIELSDKKIFPEEVRATNMGDLKTKKNIAAGLEDDLQVIAKRKMLENREKAKETVYVGKLLYLAAQNSFQSLKALNPEFTIDQVNVKDKNGNTALYYACFHGNQEFVEYLMRFGANPNIKCQKSLTPLHIGFKSNSLSLILKLLTSNFFPANLNLIDIEYKTPLAYCNRQVLQKLNLQLGVASIDPSTVEPKFDNNTLLIKQGFDKLKQDCLQIPSELKRRTKQSNPTQKSEIIISSIKSLRTNE